MFSLNSILDLRFLLLLDDLIDNDFKTFSELRELNSQFDDTYNMLLFLAPKEKGAPITDEQICDFWKWVQKLSDSRKDLRSVFTSLDARSVRQDGSKLSFDYILDPDCKTSGALSLQEGLNGLRNSPWSNLLYSDQQQQIVLSLYLLPSGEKTRFGSFNTDVVTEVQDSFNHNYLSLHPNLRATWVGTATYMKYLRDGYNHSIFINLISGSVVVLLFFLFFRSFKAGLIFLVFYQLALVPTFGLMAWFGDPIDSLSNALPILLLVAAIEDFVFVAFLKSRFKSSLLPYRKIILPCFLTSLTTVIGFGSLMSSDLDLIRRFGLWCAVGSGFEFLSFFVLLPCLEKEFGRIRSLKLNPREFLFSKIENFQKFKIPKWVSLALVILAVVPLAFTDKLNLSDAPENIFPKDHVVRLGALEVQRTQGWKSDVSLMLRDYSDLEGNREILEKVKTLPGIVGVESPYEVVDYLKSNLPEGTKNLVQRLWEQSRSSWRYLGEHNEKARAILYLDTTDIVDVNKLKVEVDGLCNGHCSLAGTLVSYGELGGRVMGSFMESMGTSLILISLTLVVLGFLTQQTGVFKIVISAIWGPLALLFIFLVFQIPVFFVTSIVIAILVGLAGDNAIQFMCHSKAEVGVKDLGTASVVANLFMSALSAVLLLSYFGALQTLGMLMILGVMLSLFGDIWVFKGLVARD
jgi:predicted RND superfamily exporter protein